MKNKKILNICLLTFALIALITFILPLNKFEAQLEQKNLVTVVFYICNAIFIAADAAIIVFAIINLFKDSYNFVLLMEVMALVCLVMNFITLMLFACMFEFKISLGYILVSVEIFMLSNFSQMARLCAKKDDMMLPKFNKKDKDRVVNAKIVKNKNETSNMENKINNEEQNA